MEIAPRLQTFEEALSVTGLDITLASGDIFTVFPPTDAAFEQFRIENGLDVNQLFDLPELETIIKNHIVPGGITTFNLMSVPFLKTINDTFLQISTEGSTIFVEGAYEQ